ncbi:MAG: NADAR family protein [Cyanobacteriota bacterium]|nr:NADAR family protein [Cyanobacteriota bacterium]
MHASDTHYVEDLRHRFNTGERLEFVFFWRHHPSKTGVSASCLSQWYSSPFFVEGTRYPTAEHFMMAEKSALFGDHATRELILQVPDPGAAKALGRQVRGFDEAAWLERRFSIVKRASQAKFSQNPELGEFLKQTGACILVEASPTDRIWGISLAEDDEKSSDPNCWRGLNLLGFALMEVRNDI